ncbi:type II secretion system protein GspD [candidate division KSB1 bacterium]|nr:type II secretion system protein GspD [candidate division KSB1 bacterium]
MKTLHTKICLFLLVWSAPFWAQSQTNDESLVKEGRKSIEIDVNSIDRYYEQRKQQQSGMASTSELDTADIQDPIDDLQNQPLINNVFYETDLRQAIQDIATQADISIVADNTVQGYVTMEIIDLPMEVALKRLLSVGGYTFKKLDGYYLVGSPDPSNPSFGLLSTTTSIPVNYIPVAQAVSLLSDYFAPFVKANIETNSLIVTGSPEIIESIKSDLKSIDQAPKQVMIKALVLEVKNADMLSAGIDWRFLGSQDNSALGGTAKLSTGLIDTLSAIFSFVRAGTGILPSGMSYSFMASINALATDGLAKIRANPSVVTTNAQPASIYISKEQYFSVVTGPVNYPYTRLEQVSVGIKLDITPFISDNNEITVKVVPEVSDAVGAGREGLPLVDRRTVNTTVRVKNNETIIIGGLTQENTRKVQNKIPILGHIPILGLLFSHTEYVKEVTDIIVFVTPEILNNM